jgi:hypothetical protein
MKASMRTFVSLAWNDRDSAPRGTREVIRRGGSSGIFQGLPLYQLSVLDGMAVIVGRATLAPLVSFDGRCGWTDVPEGDVITVESSVGWSAERTDFHRRCCRRYGETCERASYVIAWDALATRSQ